MINKELNNYQLERRNMVFNQVRASGVHDEEILNAMMVVPRHVFFSEYWQPVSYSDAELPLLNGRLTARPEMFAKVLEIAKIKKTDVVLDINCGTGYSTYLVAQFAKHVIGVDCCEDMIANAKKMAPENIEFHLIKNKSELLKLKNKFDCVIINGGLVATENDNEYDNWENTIKIFPQQLADYFKDRDFSILVFKKDDIASMMHIIKYMKIGHRLIKRDQRDGYSPLIDLD